MNIELIELLDQIRDYDRQLENLEEMREGLYKRVDEILENEEQDIIPLD